MDDLDAWRTSVLIADDALLVDLSYACGPPFTAAECKAPF
jgi:hypothetical protein